MFAQSMKIRLIRLVAGVLYVGEATYRRGAGGSFPPGLVGVRGCSPEKISKVEERKRDFLASEQLIAASHMGQNIQYTFEK